MAVRNNVVFHNRVYQRSNEIEIPDDSVLVHGDSVDDRSQSSAQIQNLNITSRINIEYNYESMEVTVNGETVSADLATDLFSKFLSGKSVVLDSTTLGFPELFLAIKSLVDIEIVEFMIIYVEPQEYSREAPGKDSFALSEDNAGYRPIPRSVIDLSSDDVEAGVFFLGFEPERLERAFEEYQMLSSKDVKLVVGIPAFQSGWELNSIVPHLEAIERSDVAYCAANDPDSAYDSLEETRASLGVGTKMFVAPIGTKPCSIAAAIFASLHPKQVGLLVDHRTKKQKRSHGVHVWHSYNINFNSNY